MTIDRMIELLKIERECMLRAAHDDCDRNCADCELVQDDYELDEMYINVISLLQEREKTRLDIAHEIISGSILMYQGKKIVRCKECIFGEQINDRYICTNAGHCQSKSNEPDWFCADGDRKEGR